MLSVNNHRMIDGVQNVAKKTPEKWVVVFQSTEVERARLIARMLDAGGLPVRLAATDTAALPSVTVPAKLASRAVETLTDYGVADVRSG